MLDSEDVEMDQAFQSTYNLLGSLVQKYNNQNSLLYRGKNSWLWNTEKDPCAPIGGMDRRDQEKILVDD